LNKKGLFILVLLFSVMFLGISGVTVADGDPFISIQSNVAFASYFDSGNGTVSNPWILENKSFVVQNMSEIYCIRIEDTTDHFIIRNCTFTGFEEIQVEDEGTYYQYHGYGLTFKNVTNGEVDDCQFYNLEYVAMAENCHNIKVSNCDAIGTLEEEGYQYAKGLNVVNCTQLFAYNNTMNYLSYALSGRGIQDSIATNNTVYMTFHGFDLGDDCDNNTLKFNSVILDRSHDVSPRMVSGAGVKQSDIIATGIQFGDNSENNDVQWNDITGFDYNGIDDAGNMWDYNLWSDYYGEDADEDGIGDTPHTIAGTAESVDEHPRLYTLSGEPYTPPARPTTPLPMIPSELLIVVTVIVGVSIIALVVIFYRKRKAP